MNKSELVAALAQKAELSKKDAEKALSAFVDVVTETLKAGDKVQLVGFGTFEAKERAPLKPRNVPPAAPAIPAPAKRSKSRPARPLLSRSAKP